MAGEGENVVVTWGDMNQTSDTLVARISNNEGQNFAPILRLAANGTIGNTEETGGETVEEAAGGASRSSRVSVVMI